MKKGIHPEYKESTIVCVCGEVIHTKSTQQNIRIDICSKCHPFYTGQQKLVDSAGRVDRFEKRYKGKLKKEKAAPSETEKAQKSGQKSLDEVLTQKADEIKKSEKDSKNTDQ